MDDSDELIILGSSPEAKEEFAAAMGRVKQTAAHKPKNTSKPKNASKPKNTPKAKNTPEAKSTPKAKTQISKTQPDTKAPVQAKKISASASLESTTRKQPPAISSLLTSNMVTFFVGPKKKEYIIHRDLICSKSATAAAYFGPLDTKTPTTEMYLPTHDPAIFALLVDFVYRGAFAETPPRQSKQDDLNASHEFEPRLTDHDNDAVNRLLSLYLLAQDWQIPDLRNHILDHLRGYIRKSNINLRTHHVATIYANVKDAMSPLRRFAVDEFVFRVMLKKGVGSLNDWLGFDEDALKTGSPFGRLRFIGCSSDRIAQSSSQPRLRPTDFRQGDVFVYKTQGILYVR
ncbi:MAG: hypothetical protein Q9186_001445 [Xanthomendoza sp. 1 TL-2023]